jgi:hypothetical protein
MSEPVSKTKQAAALLTAGDHKGCLKMMAGFRLGLSKQESNILRTGYECLVHPRMYQQLKVDVDKAVTEAVSLAKHILRVA